MSTYDQETNIAIIDWETGDTKSSAKLFSLGITWFRAANTNTIEELKQNTAHWNLQLAPQKNRTTSKSTLAWWSQQSKKAQKAHREPPLVHPVQMIEELIAFVKENKIAYLIGNGIAFDNVMLSNICFEHNMPYPVKYWGDLDLRTMAWLSDIEKPPFPLELTAHIAHHDTIAEAQVFQALYKDIKNGGIYN